jgi:hypothetical protein
MIIHTSPFRLSVLLLVAVVCFAACRKEAAMTSTEIEIRQPVISEVADGTKKLDFTIVVTQLGNKFYQDFDFKLTKWNSSAVLDSFQTTLPTAREFVKFSVIVPGPGDYWAEVSVMEDGSGSGSGTLIKIPQ